MPSELSEIRKIRKKLGMTQAALARAAGVSQSLVAKIEAGALDPGYTRTKRIFDALEAMTRKDELTAADVMNRKVITAKPEEKLSAVVKEMKKHAISQVPVVDGGKPVGVVTESLLLDALQSGRELSHAAVRELMEDCPPIITPAASIRAVAQLLHYFPVVLVATKGTIQGLITKADVIEKIV